MLKCHPFEIPAYAGSTAVLGGISRCKRSSEHSRNGSRRWYLAGVFLLWTVFMPLQQALAQNIDADPTSWDFGDVNVGDSAPKTFTITGLADGGIIDGIGIQMDIAGAFSLVGAPMIPVFIDLGDVVAFDVLFTPPSIGSFTADLRISSTDLRNPVWDVPLTGESSTAVPEPTTLTLWVLGLGGLAYRRRRLH